MPSIIIALTLAVLPDEIIHDTEVILIVEIESPRDNMLLQRQYIPSDIDFAIGSVTAKPILGAAESLHIYVVDEENNYADLASAHHTARKKYPRRHIVGWDTRRGARSASSGCCGDYRSGCHNRGIVYR